MRACWGKDPANHARRSVVVRTRRAILLGGLITMLFTAANVYLGLKVGLTFATSIPAAVVSIAVLRHFRGSNILENNIVQTIASAAGTLAAIIFVLPRSEERRVGEECVSPIRYRWTTYN